MVRQQTTLALTHEYLMWFLKLIAAAVLTAMSWFASMMTCIRHDR